MSLPNEPPLTRRAAREAMRATGEQQPITRAEPEPAPLLERPQGESGPVEEPVADAGEPPLTRRRLRELRTQGIQIAVPTVDAPVEATGPAVEATGPATSGPAAASAWAPERTEPSPERTEGESAGPVPPADPVPDTPAVKDDRPVEEAPVERPAWSAPAGHWTRQMEVVDDEEEHTFGGREVGSATPTTSALIIPQAPASMDLGGPLNSTGEILLTGSIPLSPSLATTGSVERLSDGDADLNDRFDDRRLHESAQDAAPVRASAVASQHALGTPIVSDGRSGGSRGLTVLLIAASALAVIVTGLVITALALRWI